jgi:prolipoprotein diacylglyceryltransferase
MWQELFRIPVLNVPIYGYGVMLVLGFLCAMKLAQFLAVRSKLDPELFANAALIALVTGVLGARLSHVLENLGTYTNPSFSAWENFRNAINIREGGLTYYGGFLLAFPSLVAYGMYKKVPIRLGMDIIAPCLMVGLGFGRIGCFLNGCCYGAECRAPWAVQFPYMSDAYATEFNDNALQRPVPRQLVRDKLVDAKQNVFDSPLAQYMDSHGLTELREPVPDSVRPLLNAEEYLKSKGDVRADGLQVLADQQRANPVHPAEIYSALTGFLIAAFLLAYFTVPHVPGHVFAAMMMIEGLFRYLLEMLRVEPAVVGVGTGHLASLPPQSYSMVVSFILVLGGVILWAVFSWMGGRPREASAVPLTARPVAA